MAAVGLAGATWCASSTMSTSNAYRRAVLVSRTSAYTGRSSRWARSDGSHAIDTITRGYSRNGLAFGPCVRSTLAISSLLTISNSRPNFSRISSRHFSDRLGGQTMIDGPGAVPQQQLLDDQAGLDGLAQAHVVGEQQVRPRGLQGAAQRLELVGLDVRAAAERRLERVPVRRRDRAPPHGVDERGERVRVVEAVGADRLGQALVRGDGLAHLQLPDDRELLAEAVLVERLQPDDVGEARLGLVGGAAGQALGPHVGDGPGRAPDVDDLSLLREGRNVRGGRNPDPFGRMLFSGGCQPDQPPRRPTCVALTIMAQFCDLRKSQVW